MTAFQTMCARLGRFFRTAALGFTVLVLLLHVIPFVPWIAQALATPWENPQGDVLIVLGGDQLGDGTLGIMSYWRAVYALRADRNSSFQKIVVSGGALGLQNRSISAEMASFLVGLGVPKDKILLEEHSRSTRENALFTAPLVRSLPGKKVLLTSDFHILRARRAFAKAGIQVHAAPFPDLLKRWNSWPDRWTCIWTLTGELAKLVYYRLRGWI